MPNTLAPPSLPSGLPSSVGWRGRASRGRRRRGSPPRELGLVSPVLVTSGPAPRPSSASVRGSGRSGAEWARARRRGRAGARGPGLAAGRRPLSSMRTKAAGGAERRPLQLRTESVAAAPAGRGKRRSPLLGVAGPAGWGRRRRLRRSVPAPTSLAPAAPPHTPRAAPRARRP